MVSKQEEAAPGLPPGRSRGLAGLGQLPAFELPATDGSPVRSWEFKQRQHLVLWLAGAQPDRPALAAAARREAAIHAEAAALLIVLCTSATQAARLQAELGLSRPPLVDQDGRLHARLGTEAPEVLVVDRFGTIYWRAAVAEAPPDALLDEAISWLEYVNILEHECGTCVPAWPADEADDEARRHRQRSPA